jgi:uncharacterized protein YlxP (DUF503 family)
MTVGVLRIRGLLRGCHSLKEKRQVLRSLKDRLRHTFNVAVAEVADQDFCQALEVGVATVGTDPAFVNSVLSNVLNLVNAFRGLELVDHDIEIL